MYDIVNNDPAPTVFGLTLKPTGECTVLLSICHLPTVELPQVVVSESRFATPLFESLTSSWSQDRLFFQSNQPAHTF